MGSGSGPRAAGATAFRTPPPRSRSAARRTRRQRTCSGRSALPGARSTPAPGRAARARSARIIHAIADGLERRKEEIRRLVVAEAGAAPLTHDMQVEQPIRMLRHYAELVLGFDFE